MRAFFINLIALSILATATYGQVTVSLVKDINPGPEGSSIFGMIEYNGKLYFTAIDGTHGQEIWVTDGTDTGTYMLKDIYPGINPSMPRNFFVYNEKLYFEAEDGQSQGLWVTDGTDTGTYKVKDITNYASSMGSFFEYNGKMFFAADDGIHGKELWESDGTEAGTHLFMDINPGPDWGFIYEVTEYKGLLYFGANDGVHGVELWVSDGTVEGTYMLKDINQQTSNSGYSDPRHFIEYDGNLYFVAYDGINGRNLWVTDGTEQGTQLLKAINPYTTPSHASLFKEKAILDGKLIFTANDIDHGEELWITDGTVAGTYMIKDINDGYVWSTPTNFHVYNGNLYFMADDGVHGREWWVTDGTEQGTQLFLDLHEGSLPASIDNVSSVGKTSIEHNGLIYFVATDDAPENGFELWVTNGYDYQKITPSIQNQAGPFRFNNMFHSFNDELYFKAHYDENVGQELFKLSGTPILLSISEEEALSFKVYPNPMKDVLIIECENRTPFALYDMSGKLMDSFDVHGKKEFSLSHLKTGIYILKDMNTGMVKKLVKE